VTDPADPRTADQQSILETLARSAGHELRNALNSLVVNLEVVRAQTAAAGVSVEPFMANAAAQSEESIRLAEAAVSLMLLIAKPASGANSTTVSGEKNEVRLEAGSDVARVEKALAPLVRRGVVSVETSGSTVILRIPDDSPELTGIE
jgi:signal transduction histidine kinase